MIRLLTSVAAILLLGACASASIEIQADIYKETPFAERERQEDRLVVVAANIARMKALAGDIAATRKQLAATVIDVYSRYSAMVVTIHDGDTSPAKAAASAREEFESRRPDFDTAINAAVAEAQAAADAAQIALSNYLAVVFDATLVGQERRSNEFDVRLIYEEKSQDLKQAFEAVGRAGSETSFAKGVGFVVKALPASLAQFGADEANDLAQQLVEAAAAVERLQALGVTVAANLPDRLLATAQQLTGATAVGRQEVATAAVSDLFNLSAQGSEVSHPQVRIRDIAAAQTFYNSQIDRLQDPADPAWREILDPVNKGNWVRFFSQTKFYAEGNAEVVVVRDRPGHYRVQRGVNNPAALIQGQLEISRSIASGVTAVLGAVTGVQVPLLGDPAKAGTATAVTRDNETLAQQEAEVDAVQRLRASARAAVISQLLLLTRELNALGQPEGGDQNQRDKIYDKAGTVLKSYSDLLIFTGGT